MPEAATAPEREQTTFVRGLGLFDLTMLAGSMIGSGIFIVSAISHARPGGLAARGGYYRRATLDGGAQLWRVGGHDAESAEASMFTCAKRIIRSSISLRVDAFLVIQTGTMAAVAVAFARFFSVCSCRPLLTGRAAK